LVFGWQVNQGFDAQTTEVLSCLPKERQITMPTETAIIVAGIVVVFVVFAVVLAWADYQTRNVRVPNATYFHKPK
jgi:hypothetical protein